MSILKINLQKIAHNTATIVNLANKHNIEVIGVTKGTLGDSKIAEAMIEGGVKGLADSHYQSLSKLKSLNLPLTMLRQPTKSEAKEVVRLADASLISTLKAAKWLAEEAKAQKKVHGLILMVETGDKREGIFPIDLPKLVKKIASLKGVYIQGIGTNTACLNKSVPTKEKLNLLCSLAMKDNLIISGGNSSVWNLFESGDIPGGINQLRIGEAILLGNETLNYKPIKNTYQDTFILRAEVLEVKPSAINHQLSANNVLLAIGIGDTGSGSLKPVDSRIKVKKVSSDHLVAKTTNLNLKQGDYLEFIPDYFALLALMTSPFINRVYQ